MGSGRGNLDLRRQMIDTDRICNRHMARILDRLEESSCPVLFRDAVKGAMIWLREDLRKAGDGVDGAENDVDAGRAGVVGWGLK